MDYRFIASAIRSFVLGIKRNRWQSKQERLEWAFFHLLNILDSLVYLLSGTLLRSGFAYGYLFRQEGGVVTNQEKFMKLQIILTLIGLSSFSAFGNPQAFTIATREGVKQTFLLVAPNQQPKVALLMFPGGPGRANIRSTETEILFNKNGYLQRSINYFVSSGMLVALIDRPSDLEDMSVNFRKSDEHMQDIGEVIKNILLRYKDIPIYIIGISRGSVSATYVAKHSKEKVSGVVLMAGHLADRRSVGLSGFNYKTLQQRILIVGHKNEGCPHTAFRDWLEIARSYNIPMISVTGGYQKLEMSAGDRYPECRPWAHHNFLGVEKPVAEEISNWILQKAFRSDVNG